MPDPEQNQRRAARVVVLGHGIITAPGVRANCIVRDISSTGAKLGLSRDITLPSEFDLWLKQAGSKRPVLLRWRRGDFAGVEFCQRSSATGSPATSRKEQEIWIV